jgi:hypothetical protein
MNGLLDSQTSGTDWSKPSPEMLHQVFQNTARVPLPKTERPSVEQLGLRLQEQLEQQNDTVFNLRAAVDEYGAETLYAVALWPGAVRDARRAIDQFDERWWIANSRQASGDVTFTYELV